MPSVVSHDIQSEYTCDKKGASSPYDLFYFFTRYDPRSHSPGVPFPSTSDLTLLPIDGRIADQEILKKEIESRMARDMEPIPTVPGEQPLYIAKIQNRLGTVFREGLACWDIPARIRFYCPLPFQEFEVPWYNLSDYTKSDYYNVRGYFTEPIENNPILETIPSSSRAGRYKVKGRFEYEQVYGNVVINRFISYNVSSFFQYYIPNFIAYQKRVDAFVGDRFMPDSNETYYIAFTVKYIPTRDKRNPSLINQPDFSGLTSGIRNSIIADFVPGLVDSVLVAPTALNNYANLAEIGQGTTLGRFGISGRRDSEGNLSSHQVAFNSGEVSVYNARDLGSNYTGTDSLKQISTEEERMLRLYSFEELQSLEERGVSACSSILEESIDSIETSGEREPRSTPALSRILMYDASYSRLTGNYLAENAITKRIVPALSGRTLQLDRLFLLDRLGRPSQGRIYAGELHYEAIISNRQRIYDGRRRNSDTTIVASQTQELLHVRPRLLLIAENAGFLNHIREEMEIAYIPMHISGAQMTVRGTGLAYTNGVIIDKVRAKITRCDNVCVIEPDNEGYILPDQLLMLVMRIYGDKQGLEPRQTLATEGIGYDVFPRQGLFTSVPSYPIGLKDAYVRTDVLNFSRAVPVNSNVIRDTAALNRGSFLYNGRSLLAQQSQEGLIFSGANTLGFINGISYRATTSAQSLGYTYELINENRGGAFSPHQFVIVSGGESQYTIKTVVF